jgi:hypothetical protein
LIVYREPGDSPISFGDIFESTHLIDVHVRADAKALGGGNMPRAFAEKISRALGRGITEPSEHVAVYSPALEQHADRFHVLGQGANMKLDVPVRALLLSDSCAIDTALGVQRDGRRVHGRLLFAPVVPASDEQLDSLEQTPIFGRFPLAKSKRLWSTSALGGSSGDDLPSGAVAELRHCFMVDARDVRLDDRILVLTEDGTEDLEAAWNAFALRRGPLVIEHNVHKLALALGADSAAASAIDAVEQALISAWRLEGALSGAADAAASDTSALDQLAMDLKELGEIAKDAHDRLALLVAGTS